MRNKIKMLFNMSGNVTLILFILSLSGAAVSMMIKKEEIAEKLGTFAYMALLVAAITKAVYYNVHAYPD